MKLGLVLGYGGKTLSLPLELVREAEAMGFDSCWTAEAYGPDAVSVSAWLLAHTTRIKVGTAIMQMPARTPTMAAMTAISLDQLSGGRFILGLGPSGPQVVEGWYGASYARPLSRLREYIEIVQQVFRREEPVQYQGYHYQLPYAGEDATKLGKSLKCILRAERKIPIYTASLRSNAVALSAELTDGFFPIWLNPEKVDVFAAPIAEGLARAPGDKTLADFDVAPMVAVVMGDDVQACRDLLKPAMALYIGGMGARGQNFYTTYTGQLGYPEAAANIQELYLAGKKAEAAAAVPDQLVDDVALVGPAARIRERLAPWIEAGKRGRIGTMILASGQPDAMRVIAEAVL
jgi:F420-dependent oxidoreductase-like protein